MRLRRAIAVAGAGLGVAALGVSMMRGAVARPSPGDPPAIRDRDALHRMKWLGLHRSYVRIAARGGIEGVMLGDSLTFGWLVTAPKLFSTVFTPRHVRAFGIGGDRTEDLLWRIRDGELSGGAPRVVSILIGTNDLTHGSRTVALGIGSCVSAVRAAVPSAKILLLGLLPRGGGGARMPRRVEIEDINASISRLADGRTVRYLDMGPHFVLTDGRVDPRLYEPDLIHLSAEGYGVWAKAVLPEFDALLR